MPKTEAIKAQVIPERYHGLLEQYERQLDQLKDAGEFAAECANGLDDARAFDFLLMKRLEFEETIAFGLYLFRAFEQFARELEHVKELKTVGPVSDAQKAKAVYVLFSAWLKPCRAVMDRIRAWEAHPRGFRIANRDEFVAAWKSALRMAIDPDRVEKAGA